MLNIVCHLGNANENHKEVLPHTLKWLKSKSVVKDPEEQELFIQGWRDYKHGKQAGSFLKSKFMSAS